MKRTICVLSYLFAAVLISAQSPDNLLKEDLTRAGVNTNSYEFNDYSYTPAPKGYKAFYISHYGRHGSRSNWGDKNYKNVINVLSQAKEQGILSASGDSLLAETRMVLEGYNGMDGRLTARGTREQKLLARRMFERDSDVFKKGSKKIRVETSTVPRCIISMAGFTNSLTSCQRDLQYSFDTGEKFFEYINNDSGDRIRKAVMPRLDSLMAATPVDTVSILPLLFTDSEAARKLIHSVSDFETDIWYTACIAEDFDVPTTPFRYLPYDVIRKYWDYHNRELYMRQCNSVEYGDERMVRAMPLVRVVLKYADEAIENGSVSADLKFGHDYPLLSLASFIGIEGVGDRLTFNEVPDKWFGPALICMASNLQMIFYRNKSNNVLVKFLYNEKESKIRGIEPVSGPYYDWAAIRESLISKLDFYSSLAGK